MMRKKNDTFLFDNSLDDSFGNGGSIDNYKPVTVTPAKPVQNSNTTVMTLSDNTNLLKQTLGATNSILPPTVYDAILTGAGIAGTPVSALPNQMGAEVTITAQRSYWWLLVLVVVIITAIFSFRDNKSYKR